MENLKVGLGDRVRVSFEMEVETVKYETRIFDAAREIVVGGWIVIKDKDGTERKVEYASIPMTFCEVIS